MQLSIGNLWPAVQKEYLIYTYGGVQAGEVQAADKWSWHSRAKSHSRAIRKARNLYRSGLYQKIEIKAKYFDRKKQRHVDEICRVFEKSQKRDKRLFLTLSFSLLSGIFVFWLMLGIL